MLAHAIDALQGKLVAEFHTSPDLFDEIARMEMLLAETYRDRFLYELLQNSDDAGSSTVRVEHVSPRTLIWQNDGRPLNAADVESLCRSARSTKKRDDDSIGYRGIGFKSLAAVAESIDVESDLTRLRFDRRESSALVGSAAAMPLIRIPVGIGHSDVAHGARFTVELLPGAHADIEAIDPLALLFLRRVRRLDIISATGQEKTLHTHQNGEHVVLSRHGHATATFAVREVGAGAQLAVPLDAAALTFVGARGRLSCFLPLADCLGIPCVASGMVMTDPSRTHAVVQDPATLAVIDAAARAVAGILGDSTDPLFDRMWELCLTAEDPRATLSGTADSVARRFWSTLKDATSASPLPVRHSPIGYTAAEVDLVRPANEPRALYLEQNRGAARALKAVFGLAPADVSSHVGRDFQRLSPATQQRVIEHVRGTAEAFGRPLTSLERRIVDQSASQAPVVQHEPTVASVKQDVTSASMASHLHKWRAAEKAVMTYLNELGWDLEDVSQQNLGYDLAGRNAEGSPAFVEVKKVDGPDSRFAVTSNEMSFLQSRPDAYWFAMVVGQGHGTRLFLIPAGRAELPFERVCRRWDWECANWSRSGVLM